MLRLVHPRKFCGAHESIPNSVRLGIGRRNCFEPSRLGGDDLYWRGGGCYVFFLHRLGLNCFSVTDINKYNIILMSEKRYFYFIV